MGTVPQIEFIPAIKEKSQLRLAIYGPSGSGKTWTSLSIAAGLVAGGRRDNGMARIAVVDTERGSARLYADKFTFDVVEIDYYSTDVYVEAIRVAVKNGYEALIIDSLSHAWDGTGGIQEMVDQFAQQSKSQNTFQAWGKVKPKERQLWDGLLGAKTHIIATMRSKTEYVINTDERGKNTPQKVGTAPIQRKDFEYEFQVVAEMNTSNVMSIDKTRCDDLRGKTFENPGADVARILATWLETGVTPAPKWLSGANADKNVRTVIENVHKYIDGISDFEILKYAGIKAMDDMSADGWGKFDTGKLAYEAIIAAWEAEIPPPNPPVESAAS